MTAPLGSGVKFSSRDPTTSRHVRSGVSFYLFFLEELGSRGRKTRGGTPLYKPYRYVLPEYCKADLKQRILFFITVFRLTIPAFFRFTDVTELM